MEPQLLQEQLKVTKADLPAWNNTERTARATRNEADDTVEKLVDILHQRGPSGISLPAPAKKDQKPSDHWRGTIDLLLRVVQVGSEADLPDVWSAWARANKKEHRNVLQEKLQETAVLLGYPQPVATGELTQMLVNLQFVSPDEDDLESGLQPFAISYHGQKTLAQLQRMNNMYDMIQQGAQPNLSDLFTLKEASKISVPTNESQCLRTLKSFAVLLATLLGTTSAIYKVFKRDVVEAFETHQPAVETYALSLPGKLIYAEILRWVQLRFHSYWSLVVRTTTGLVAPPRFDDLYEQITYKQWHRPSLPSAYLPEPLKTPGHNDGDPEDGPADKKPTKKKKLVDSTQTEERNYLRNPNFDMDLKQLGVEMGKISIFLKKAGPGGGRSAVSPNMQGGQACLTWHTKGHCWDHCDKAASHVAPNAAEKEKLMAFIAEGLQKIE
jgi:hypothetical protein